MNKYQSLTPEVLHIIKEQGTEPPFSGAGCYLNDEGSYLCRCCGLALFRSTDKFNTNCGWLSFENVIPQVIEQLPDEDGLRTKIHCRRCHAHLGHLFIGEGFTKKNRRYCVNSLALDFVAHLTVQDTEEALFAGGCFWGIQYQFQKEPGVLLTEVGYTGGHLEHPSYKQVCTGKTGHFEAVRVVYDPHKRDYASLIKRFFNMHNPIQTDGQGPDIGSQYRSAIFYFNEEQRQLAKNEIALLKKKLGLEIATLLIPVTIFWPAEEYHQNYRQKKQNI